LLDTFPLCSSSSVIPNGLQGQSGTHAHRIPTLTYWVYLLASRRYGTLYVGVTNSLSRRIAQHRAKEASGFTSRYGVQRLVWFQGFGEVTDAIDFEKRLKRWRREWKIQLIEQENPVWDDLYDLLIAEPEVPPPSVIPDAP
jgi:putative endonuclease